MTKSEKSLRLLNYRILAVSHSWTNLYTTWPILHAWTSAIDNISWKQIEIINPVPDTEYGLYFSIVYVSNEII